MSDEPSAGIAMELSEDLKSAEQLADALRSSSPLTELSDGDSENGRSCTQAIETENRSVASSAPTPSIRTRHPRAASKPEKLRELAEDRTRHERSERKRKGRGVPEEGSKDSGSAQLARRKKQKCQPPKNHRTGKSSLDVATSCDGNGAQSPTPGATDTQVGSAKSAVLLCSKQNVSEGADDVSTSGPSAIQRNRTRGKPRTTAPSTQEHDVGTNSEQNMTKKSTPSENTRVAADKAGSTKQGPPTRRPPKRELPRGSRTESLADVVNVPEVSGNYHSNPSHEPPDDLAKRSNALAENPSSHPPRVPGSTTNARSSSRDSSLAFSDSISNLLAKQSHVCTPAQLHDAADPIPLKQDDQHTVPFKSSSEMVKAHPRSCRQDNIGGLLGPYARFLPDKKPHVPARQKHRRRNKSVTHNNDNANDRPQTGSRTSSPPAARTESIRPVKRPTLPKNTSTTRESRTATRSTPLNCAPQPPQANTMTTRPMIASGASAPVASHNDATISARRTSEPPLLPIEPVPRSKLTIYTPVNNRVISPRDCGMGSQAPARFRKPMTVPFPHTPSPRCKRQAADRESSGGESLSAKRRKTKLAHLALLHRSRQPRGPLPDGMRPHAWANTRQELCETLLQFRSYQGGVYCSATQAFGYLLAGHPATRDCFFDGGRKIIGHGGGSNENDASRRSGRTIVSATDQEVSDKSVSALINASLTQIPIYLVVDDAYPAFPFDLGNASNPYSYAGLGYYLITSYWAEKHVDDEMTPVVRFKFCFERIPGQKAPWWQQSDEVAAKVNTDVSSGDTVCEDPPDQRRPRPEKLSSPSHCSDIKTYWCTRCTNVSPRIFEREVCLHPTCLGFWMDPSGQPIPEYPEYSNDFMRSKAVADTAVVTPDDPPLMTPAPNSIAVSTSESCTRGYYCSKCGRMSCRVQWSHWKCKKCLTRVESTAIPRFPLEFRAKYLQLNLKVSDIATGSGITKSFRTEPKISGFVTTYELPTMETGVPSDTTRVHIVRGSTVEADGIFRSYQEEAMKDDFLQRWPTRVTQLKGEMLSQYFSHNAGAPYKYVAGTQQTVPLDQAPEPVKRALSLIQNRARLVLPHKYRSKLSDFNEILTAAYMEKQKMDFHTDDEKGLGPVVASLSLGGAATMSFRRRHIVDEHRHTELKIVLGHGDVVVMEGAAVQKHWEHRVACDDNLRFAATARLIGSSHYP